MKKILLITSIILLSFFAFLSLETYQYKQEYELSKNLYDEVIYFQENINVKYVEEDKWNEQLTTSVDAIYNADSETKEQEVQELEVLYNDAIELENKEKEDQPIRYYTKEVTSDIATGIVDGTTDLISAFVYIINPTNWDDVFSQIIYVIKNPIDTISYTFNSMKLMVEENGIIYFVSYYVPDIVIPKLINDNLSSSKVLVDDMYYVIPGNKYSGLKPNIKYSPKPNQIYETDSLGRITSVEAKDLKLDPDNVRNNYAQSSLEKREGDDAGHLVGHQFGGSGDMDNLVSMDRSVNRGNYKEIENELRQAIENDQTVNLNVEVDYMKTSNIPYRFVVEYEIDSVNNQFVLYNY